MGHRLATMGVIGLLWAGTGFAQEAGDPVAGAQRARICKSCHQFGLGAGNSVGPVLNGVVGRRAGTYPGYDYSVANRDSGIVWHVPTLKVYLRDPKARVPGTKMSFAGFSRQADIDNVVAFLATLGPDGNPKPADPAAPAKAATP